MEVFFKRAFSHIPQGSFQFDALMITPQRFLISLSLRGGPVMLMFCKGSTPLCSPRLVFLYWPRGGFSHDPCRLVYPFTLENPLGVLPFLQSALEASAFLLNYVARLISLMVLPLALFVCYRESLHVTCAGPLSHIAPLDTLDPLCSA